MRIPFCWYPFFIAFFRTGGASIIAHTAHQINEEIHDKEVRLISAQGEQLGIMPLADGNRVKVAVRFRGREMAHTDIGKRLLEKFTADCAEVATMDKEPKLDGRHMTMFLSCKQNKDTKK